MVRRWETGEVAWPQRRYRTLLEQVFQVRIVDLGFRRRWTKTATGWELAPHAEGDADQTERWSAVPWPTTPGDATLKTARLWEVDMHRRRFLAAPWVALAALAALDGWKQPPPIRSTARDEGRRVGASDVAAVWAMADSLSAIDHQLGGGHARSTLVHYATTSVTPLLRGSSTDAVGRDLFSAAARICDLLGFMCFDICQHGLAQRCFTQALNLAHLADDQALGSHILADMSIQALYTSSTSMAVDLAESAVAGAQHGATPLVLARAYTLRGRALAARGHLNLSHQSFMKAELELDRADAADEPAWIRFFTHRQLSAEAAYASLSLSRPKSVREHVAGSMAVQEPMQRRHVLTGATLAMSYLPLEGRASGSHVDIEAAADAFRSTFAGAGALDSERSQAVLSLAARRLVPFADHPAVHDLGTDLRALATASGWHGT